MFDRVDTWETEQANYTLTSPSMDSMNRRLHSILDNIQNDDSAPTSEPSPKRKRISGGPLCKNYFPFCLARHFELYICYINTWLLEQQYETGYMSVLEVTLFTGHSSALFTVRN